MTNTQLKKDLITRLRADLSATPITLGTTIYNNIYRRYDTKTTNTNYFQIFFVDVWFKEPNYEEIRVVVDCYAQNEIRADKMRQEIKKRLDKLILADNQRITNIGFRDTVTKLNTDRYVGRISGMLYFHSTCEK